MAHRKINTRLITVASVVTAVFCLCVVGMQVRAYLQPEAVFDARDAIALTGLTATAVVMSLNAYHLLARKEKA
jgi:hypothetical protein